MRAYVLRTNDKALSKPITDDDKLRQAIASRMRPFEDPFRLREHGDAPGPWLKRAPAIDRVTAKTLHGAVGLAIELRNKAGKGIVSRVIDVRVPSSITNANEKVDRWFLGLDSNCGPGILNLGCTVCKSIGSTSSRSQHSPWTPLSTTQAKAAGFSSASVSDEGNAGDAAHSGGRAAMKKMWEWSLANRDDLGIVNLIHWPIGSPTPLIWNEAGGIHVYDVPPGGSNHSDHVHADFSPSRPFGNSNPGC
jgi:hypothetical protein